MASWLLACDLDGTLIPTDPAITSHPAIEILTNAVRQDRLTLAYVTGRHLSLALEGIRAFGLPVPEWLACDVGTSLYRRSGNAYRPHAEFQNLLTGSAPDFQTAVRNARLDDIVGLTLQPPDRQGPLKASYLVEPAAGPHVAAEVSRRLAAEASPAGVVFSLDPVSGAGLLDVLATPDGKRTVVAFLRQQLGLDERSAIFAGDSGNDCDALLAGHRAILVGNAPAGLKDHVRREAAALGLADAVYIADAAYAAGVIEGCRHFGWL